MPGPLAPLAVIFGSGLVAGLVSFFASKAGMMLAAFGLTMIAYKGLETFMGFVITDIQTVVAFLNSGGGGGNLSGLGVAMLQFAAYAGLFDGINILISGYLSIGSMVGLKVVLRALR